MEEEQEELTLDYTAAPRLVMLMIVVIEVMVNIVLMVVMIHH